MTTTQETPDLPRDRWGRPLIVPPEGGKLIAYTRVSTLAKTLDDKTALTKWMCRQTAIGLSQRPDLVALAGTSGDDKRAIGEIVDKAMAEARSDAAANIGTTLHSITESWDRGNNDLTFVSSEMQDDLHAYAAATERIEMESIEVFIVQDELRAAGTFDRIVRLPDGRRMVADLKTGQHEPNYPHGACTQIAVYAHGTAYTADAGRVAALADHDVSQTEGLMIHLPAGQKKCDLYIVDLTVGWDLAQTAARVRAMQKQKPISLLTL